MKTSPRRGGPRYAPVAIGVITFLISLGLAGSLLALDLSKAERRASRQLDLAGQNLIETLADEIRSRELGLIDLAGDPGVPGEEYAQRLSPMLVWPEVLAVGHAVTDQAPVEWYAAAVMDLPKSVEGSVEQAATLWRANDTIHIVHGDKLVLAYPTEIGSRRSWDLLVIDMVAAADGAVPEDFAGDLTWSIRAVPEGELFKGSEPLVRRAYLRLEDSSSWLVEFHWTTEALAELGVAIHPVGAAVGVALSLTLAWLAAHLVQRKYLQVDLEASRGMLEQKDLLLLALSHQLRTPLTAVIGFLAVALDGERPLPDTQRDELLELASGQAQEAGEIVDDLMVAARINNGNLVLLPKPLEVGLIIDSVFRSTQTADEVLELDGGGSEALVYADPLRIRQLIRNVFEEGRVCGARRWKVVTTPSETAVGIAFIADFEIPDRPLMGVLSADMVASPAGLVAIQPHLITATRLAEVMGGGITFVSVGGATAISVLLPRTHIAADQVEPLVTTTNG